MKWVTKVTMSDFTIFLQWSLNEPVLLKGQFLPETKSKDWKTDKKHVDSQSRVLRTLETAINMSCFQASKMQSFAGRGAQLSEARNRVVNRAGVVRCKLTLNDC